MAASQIEMYGRYASSGKPFSFKVYAASAASAGSYLTARLKGDAGSNDSYDLHVPGDVIIDDVISSCTAGVIRLESDGDETYVLINLPSRAATNSGRNQKLGIPMGYGKTYRWIVETSLNA